MKIHEYQAKEYLRRFGLPVSEGEVAASPAEARQAAERLGGRVVVKAQVHAGGRGKVGGVKLVDSPQEAEEVAASLLGGNLVTHQTGPDGVPVRHVLVESTTDIAQELYLSIVVDGGARGPVVMGSEAGGMDIEEVAEKMPEKIIRINVDPTVGIQSYQGRKLAYAMNMKADLIRPFADLVSRLFSAFQEGDCSLVEINPLVITEDGKLLCLDAKINLEDDALFRHQELAEWSDPEQEDALELQAAEYGIQYINLDGDVGCLVNGAGLAMATMDTALAAGAEPANFLDVGGGADEDKVAQAFKLILSDPKVRRVLVNIFGGILRCDVAARGVVQAAQEVEVNVPIVARMLGTNAEEGRQILQDSGLQVSFANDMREATELLRQGS